LTATKIAEYCQQRGYFPRRWGSSALAALLIVAAPVWATHHSWFAGGTPPGTGGIIPPSGLGWYYNWVTTRGYATNSITNLNTTNMVITLGTWTKPGLVSWTTSTPVNIAAGQSTNIVARLIDSAGIGYVQVPFEAYAYGTWSAGGSNGLFNATAEWLKYYVEAP